jgi:hypothetical protein
LSVVPWEGGYIGVLREFDPAAPTLRTELRLMRYDLAGRILEDSLLCRGEDPRVFMGNDGPYAWFWTCDNGRWSHFLVGLEQRRVFPFDSLVNGKNFMPVRSGLVVESLVPFFAQPFEMEAGALTGRDKRVVAWLNDAAAPYSPWRGGAAILEVEGKGMVGYGYRSVMPDCHLPFRFTLSHLTADKAPDLTIEMIGDGAMSGINGPTSFWVNEDGQEMVVTCHTEYRWSMTQPCSTILSKVVWEALHGHV